MGSESILLKDICESSGMAVPEYATLRELVARMQANGKGVCVVVTAGTPVGILTERDVVELLRDGVDLGAPAQPYARKPLVEVSGERALGYAMTLMVENGIRRLVVVGAERRFLGVVTQQDLLRYLEEDFYRSALRVKHIQDQFPPLVTSSTQQPICEVLDLMVRHRISAVPVVEADVAVGIITEKDVLRLANQGTGLHDPVGKHMSSPVVSVGWDARLQDIVKRMNDGRIRRVVVADADGRAVAMVTNRDLVRNLEGDYNELLERKLRYTKEVLNLLPQMLVEVLDTGRLQLVVWANQRVLDTFGRGILDRPITDLIPGERWQEVHRGLLDRGKVEDVRYKRGDDVFELSGFYLPLGKEHERGRVQLVLRDITQEFRMATTDPLTEIFNRRYMNEILSMEAERSRRMGRSFAVVIVDVDDFKRVNDTFGHFSGDLVLKSVVSALRSETREYDVVGRYGGEEFLIVMPEIEPGAAASVVERVRARVEAQVVECADGRTAQVTASFGVAAYGRDGTSPEDLLVRADERLYRAKREGKNRVLCA